MIKRFIVDFRKYYHYIVYASKAELKSEVAGSYLNWLWWILNPLCMMMIYSFVFGFLLGGVQQYHSIFIFIALTMWNFFNHTVTQSVRLIKKNKAIVSKVYLPKFVLVLVKMFVNGFKMFIGFCVVFLMMMLNGIWPTLSILWMVPILSCLILFTFACSCFVLHFGVFIEDLSNIVSLFFKLLFYASGIFYDIENKLQSPLNYYFLRLNPIALLISDVRNILLYHKTVHLLSLISWILASLVLFYLGVRLIYKNENNYVKVG